MEYNTKNYNGNMIPILIAFKIMNLEVDRLVDKRDELIFNDINDL